jgi:ADP-ribose pyrophosphatase YjhB (NUDIX family)
MKFCGKCAAPVTRRTPPGDDRPRDVCDSCGAIFYENPKIVAGCIPVRDEKILLCRRSIEPRAGFWTLPAGFMENGETTQEAAARETLEEACARVEIGALFAYLNIPRLSQVYVIFLAELLSDFAAGAESLEAGLFQEDEIPWPEIAFPSIQVALELYLEDRRRGVFSTHSVDIRWRAGEKRPARGDSKGAAGG